MREIFPNSDPSSGGDLSSWLFQAVKSGSFFGGLSRPNPTIIYSISTSGSTTSDAPQSLSHAWHGTDKDCDLSARSHLTRLVSSIYPLRFRFDRIHRVSQKQVHYLLLEKSLTGSMKISWLSFVKQEEHHLKKLSATLSN